MTNYKTYAQILMLYVFAFGAELLAQNFSNFFWSIYLPLIVAANVLLFDEILQIIDLNEIILNSPRISDLRV